MTNKMPTNRGEGGAIAMQGDTLTLSRGARLDVSTQHAGRGGRVTVAAHDVRLEAEVRLSATAAGAGDGGGGSITVSTREATLTGGAQISSSSGRVNSRGQVVAGRSNGGNVILSAIADHCRAESDRDCAKRGRE
jgi:hypothetical protein